MEGAEIGEPVPGEHALAADDEAVAVEFDGMEEASAWAGRSWWSRMAPA
jgi:hypothetical protein